MKTTKSGKRRRRFLHGGALALASMVSSGYCTVPLPHRRCLSPVLAKAAPIWLLTNYPISDISVPTDPIFTNLPQHIHHFSLINKGHTCALPIT